MHEELFVQNKNYHVFLAFCVQVFKRTLIDQVSFIQRTNSLHIIEKVFEIDKEWFCIQFK